jgi:cysteine desulfurase family protein (TIGR01976 family)
MSLDISMIREQFPALQRAAIYLDNPAGTQVSQSVLDRMQAYLIECNANYGGAFQTSRQSDAVVAEARRAMADFVNAVRPEEIVFGPNMTTLTFNLSRALGRWLKVGDEIVVTHLDHDANITPWVMVAEEHQCKIRWVDFQREEGTLNMARLESILENKPRLVAVGYASNALGTVNPVTDIVKMAKEVGALVFIDAVQYAPHGPIDVQELGCDFLVCSAYKFFGPHVGVLYGRYELLDELEAYKVRPASNKPPGKFETGTQNFEGIAGLLGAIEYLEWVGAEYGERYTEKYESRYKNRKLYLKQAMAAIRAYEYELSRALLENLQETPGVTIYGLQDVRRLEERVPTFSFTVKGKHPRQLAEALDKAGIYVWDGNYYALAVTEWLSLEEGGGMVRVGPVHYNTEQEIQQFGEALRMLTLDT